MQRLGFFIVFILFSCTLQAGDDYSIDSLQRVIKECDSDTTRLNTIFELIDEFADLGEYEECVNYGNKALILAQSLSKSKTFSSFGKLGTVHAYQKLGIFVEQTKDFDLAVPYFLEGIKIAKKEKYKDLECQLTGNISMFYYNQGDYPEALNYAFQQLDQAELLNDKKKIASAYNKIGIVYKRQMMHEEALNYLDKSILIYQELNDLNKIANGINNKGDVYLNQKNYADALLAYRHQLKIGKQIENNFTIADANKRIGNVFAAMFDLSVDSILLILPTWKNIDYSKIKLVLADSSLSCINSAKDYFTEIKNVYEISDCLNGIAYAQQLKGLYFGAIKTYLESFELSNKAGILEKEKSAAYGLYENYLKAEEYKESLHWLQTYHRIKDSIYNESAQRELGRLESKHEFEVKEAEMLAEQEQQNTKVLAEKTKQQIIIWTVSIVLLLVVVFSIFLFNRFKITQKQKKTIEFQKVLVDEKNKEITDSISYALRIQTAILPPQKLVKKYLQDSFILYKPKDIVAGDFYWLTSFAKASEVADSIAKASEVADSFAKASEVADGFAKNSEVADGASLPSTGSVSYIDKLTESATKSKSSAKEFVGNVNKNAIELIEPVEGNDNNYNNDNDIIMFAACDCTGHGVPGAMVSVVCHNALNRSVREFGLRQPAAILNKTREIVLENFSLSEDNIKDGMDISLCALNLKTKTMEWAGANNPLWRLKNGTLIEIKADKQPIGMVENFKPFTNHQINLESGEILYLFTDGYADQFGGELGQKKLTKKRFKDLIISLQSKSMHEQGLELDAFINNYRKKVEQIDDILVIGIRI